MTMDQPDASPANIADIAATLQAECSQARAKAWKYNQAAKWGAMHRENGRAAGLARAINLLGYDVH